jgi:hypothetical protein
MESLHDHAQGSARGELSRFRQEFYASLTARADARLTSTASTMGPSAARGSGPAATARRIRCGSTRP